MLVNLDTRDPRPIYLQIMDEVRRALVVGALRAGEPLPSVRGLASELEVNPRTVRQAYGELEREGLVYTKRGLGTFVADAALGRDQRRELARRLAKRVLLEARRNGLGLDELVAMMREVAAEERPEPVSGSTEVPGSAGERGGEE